MSGIIKASEAEELSILRAEVKRHWTAACKHDGIDPESKFVEFSRDNPYVEIHNTAMGQFQRALKRVRANQARRAKHAAMTSLGLKRVKGALGGVYYE